MPPGSPAPAPRRAAREPGPPAAARPFDAAAPTRRPGRGYSRFVRGMKLALPVAAALIITLVIAWPQLDGHAPPAPDRIQVKPEDADNLNMLDARYVGSDDHDRPFTITADSARQVAPQKQQVELDHPQADVTLEGGAWVALSADRGLFDRESETLELTGDVNLFHDEGYQLSAQTARVDIRAGTAESRDPVEGHGPVGELSGQGFRVLDQGRTVILTGKSRVLIRPDQLGSVRP